jgi:TonB-dependent receptor
MSGTAALLLSISSPTLIAQEVNKAVSERSNEPTEVIEVSGVRASLENALNVKRGSASIVDAISATDIDALPALDLGEALQAIPGVQLNSDEEGRQSSISLRGLGGGFVKTTAFGQSFATPSAASNVNAVGSPNPFSAFEASIFDGVTVIKSPTADLQAGGVAGIVDKKLQQALSKKDGTATASLGGRYEELTGKWDPNIRLSGVKHLLKDKLGVGIKLAASGQTFRRDTFDIIDYVDVNPASNIPNAGRVDGRVSNLAEYLDAHGLPADASLTVPIRGRNVSEFSDGDRISFAGNIEYRITDDLKVGTHLLYSKRDLDDGTKETTSFGPGFNRNRGDRDFFSTSVELDLDTAPFIYRDRNGAPVYAASRYDFVNGNRQNENRKTTFQEESKGVMVYADYAAGDWVLDGVVTHSEASNDFQNIGINFNHVEDWRRQTNFTDANGLRRNVPAVGTGFDGTIDTGRGNINDIVVQGQFAQDYVYDDLVWNVPTLSSGSVTSISDANQGRRVNLTINGRVRDISREFSSAEFNAQRYTDFGLGDFIRFDSVKSGFRVTREELDSVDQRQGAAGINTANISGTFLSPDVLSAVQNEYFGGNIPGTFDNTSGWLTIQNDLTISALQDGLITDINDIAPGRSDGTRSEFLSINRSGFWDTQDINTHLPTNLGFNFDATQDTFATYITTDISGEFADIAYTGNLGVRYIVTDNVFNGFETQVEANGRNGTAVPSRFEDDYTHTLPMMNIAFELSEDWVLRTAYYEALVRPNLLSQRPTAALRGGAQSATVNLPSATLRPYTAKNYDVSIEWYNREGSAITLGYFQKDLSNLFGELRNFCPSPGQSPLVDRLLGPLERGGSDDGALTSCTQLTPSLDEDGTEIFREVDVRAPVNVQGDLSVEGFELAIQQNLDFLPYPWNGFGGVFNYTKLRQSGDDSVTISRVSPESFNLIGYWENDGVSLRLAYNWRDQVSIIGANAFLGNRTRDAFGRLDFVGSYKLNKKTKVFLRGFNLTDEIGTEFQGTNPEAVSRLTYTGRVYQVAVNYRF